MNEHIEQYLDYYCGLKVSPEYGVLLKGAWGAGKTWFIKNYIKKLEDQKKKCIYVSLYGVATTNEIEDLFFQQLHPILSSKGMELTSKILKGVLKATIKVDLDGDGTADGVGAQIPDVNFPDYLKDTGNCILIFDDLERCKMDIDNILGYINHFVEHQGLKSIIIANEEELIKKEKKKEDENDSGYRNIKEKLIGKTFQIVADLDNAINVFISSIEDKNTGQFLKYNTELIKQLYNLSTYENLRNLKQSLWDFERIYICLPDAAKNIEPLLCDILSLLLAYSFELRRGKILPEEIIKFRSEYYSGLFSDKKDEEENKIKEIIKKYSERIRLHDPIPNEHFWRIFFDKGYADEKLIEESLNKSKYFKDEQTPNWARLWHLLELSDEEFEEVFKAVFSEFQDRVYTDVGVIKHVVGMFLWLSDIGIKDAEKDAILQSAKEYVNFLKKEGKLSFEAKQRILSRERESYAGLCFFGNEFQEFQELCNYIEKCQLEAKADSMPGAGKELLKIMQKDVSRFSRMICLCNSSDQVYYETPIFKYIAPEDFVSTYFNLPPDDRRTVFFALEERYKFENTNQNLLEEIEWHKAIKGLFEKEAELRQGKVSGYVLRSAVDSHLTKIIEKLEKGQQNAPADPGD